MIGCAAVRLEGEDEEALWQRAASGSGGRQSAHVSPRQNTHDMPKFLKKGKT